MGPRLALEPEEVGRIQQQLLEQNALHDRCLFCVAVDSMLRSSDLLRLTVADVAFPDGTIRERFSWRQHKTSGGVYPVLTATTRQACREWIEASFKSPTDYLFTRYKPIHDGPIGNSAFRVLIKSWVAQIGLDPTLYSGHSLRRTKPVFLYRSGVAIEDIAQLLGHKDIRSTQVYLGLSVAQAQAQALEHDIFARGARRKASPSHGEGITEEMLARVAERVVEELITRFPWLVDPPNPK